MSGKECNLKGSINIDRGTYIEKEKIDHPHELKLETSNQYQGTTFTCSNITLHSKKQIINKPYLEEVERTIIYDYEKGEYTKYSQYYKCTYSLCNYNLCLECYSNVYGCTNIFKTGGVKVEPAMFNSLTDVEQIISKVNKLYGSFTQSNNNKYIIQGKDEIYLWYDFTETSSYFREAGDKSAPYKCEKCDHLYSCLIPRYINKTNETMRKYICAFCSVDFSKEELKTLKNFTYCNIYYTFNKPQDQSEFIFNNCSMCKIQYNNRDGEFINDSEKIYLCLSCGIKINNFYSKLPEKLKLPTGLLPEAVGKEVTWKIFNKTYNCNNCKKDYPGILGKYTYDNNNNICPNCIYQNMDNLEVKPFINTLVGSIPNFTLKSTPTLSKHAFSKTSKKKLSKRSRKRSLKRSRKRSVKKSRKRSLKKSRKLSLKKSQ